jgi:Icc-related predicted phosphoesterase
MKILAVGDKESSYIWDHFNPEAFRDVKLVISTGDLDAEYLSFIVTMLNVPLLYVPGNHDGRYKTKAPEGCQNIDGRIVTIGNINIMGLGGSILYNHGPYQFTEKEMSSRLKKLRFSLWRKKRIDIFVSHAPAMGINDGEDPCHKGFGVFREILDKYKPRFFLHGHQHLSYGSGAKRLAQYGDTTVINSEGYYLFEY